MDIGFEADGQKDLISQAKAVVGPVFCVVAQHLAAFKFNGRI